MENESYRLPFKDHQVCISQGYGGPYSHYAIRDNKDRTYSLDFDLPLGTEIIASKSGRVKSFYEKTTEYYKGMNLDLNQHPLFLQRFIGNFIRIQHDDGTIALYEHLMPESISNYIKKGQRVKQNEIIGLLGLSGWIGENLHLHYSVSKRFKIGQRIVSKTMPTEFADYNGKLMHSEIFPEDAQSVNANL